MDTRMLGVMLQPFCKKCCGARSKADSTIQKRRARQIQKREVRALIREEV